MLRDCVYTLDASIIRSILQKFDVDVPKEMGHMALLRFEVLSPDAFMWRLRIGESIYYLFAEDYIPGLDYVRNIFNAYLAADNWKLVQALDAKAFEEAEPVQRSIVYSKPEDADSLMKYAADSGNDFVFLAKSSENADQALFSDDAPHGFAYGSVPIDNV